MFSPLVTCSLRQLTNIEANYIRGCSIIPVRWRKLRHKQRAPSKFFVVREPTINAPGEDEFLKEHLPKYRTQIKAISKLFKDQYQEKGIGGQDNLDRIKNEEEEHAEMMKLNEKWNAEVAAAREVRVAMETLEHRRAATAAIERKTRKSLEDLERVEEEIQMVKARSKEFITMDNIDSKLEELLDCRVDYNFAIDTEGNKYYPDGWEPKANEQRTRSQNVTESVNS
ncbi:uncharacterized protein LOC135489133 [Lineus longissimus]|uniref:uncharacterized protein LOC135489133 n=1 Tax=Lineus longissimus TaxID=88925 RepID=UPI002B4DF053